LDSLICQGKTKKTKLTNFINLKKLNKMKKRNSILMVLIIFTSLILSSCGGSVKGKWSEADKQSFRKDMEAADLSAFGENKTKMIECYLSKTEAAYSSYAEADQDLEGCTKLAKECSDEILSNGSVKGKWSEADKQKFNTDMESVDLSGFGENKAKWLDCYLSKAEAKYSSYAEADSDLKGCEVIANECNKEISK
jgi:hypothetical protein